MQEALISLASLFFQYLYQIEAYRSTIDIVFSRFPSEKDSFLFSFCFYKKGDGGKVWLNRIPIISKYLILTSAILNCWE